MEISEPSAVLTFNQSVKIYGSKYRNRNNAFSRTYLTPKAQKINILGNLDTLSLNYFQEMNVENVNYIGTLLEEVNSKTVVFLVTIHYPSGVVICLDNIKTTYR